MVLSNSKIYSSSTQTIITGPIRSVDSTSLSDATTNTIHIESSETAIGISGKPYNFSNESVLTPLSQKLLHKVGFLNQSITDNDESTSFIGIGTGNSILDGLPVPILKDMMVRNY